MYFSRIRISPDARVSPTFTMNLCNDAYGAHKLVWRAFPSEPGTARDFLFRRESETEQLGRVGAHSSSPVFYVVSKRPPTDDDPIVKRSNLHGF